MPGDLQPLDQQICDCRPGRSANALFHRNGHSSGKSILAAGSLPTDAQTLIDDWAAHRQILAGRALDGGGFLSGDVTIDHAESLVVPGTYGSATMVPQLVVDQEGHVQGVTEVPITGGGGGGVVFRVAV
jgi:hypothetical protein